MYCVTFGRAGKIYSISMSKFSIPTDGKKRREKNWTFFFFKFVNAMLVTNIRLRVVPHFSSGTVERMENHPTRDKATCGVSPFLAWGDFHARSLYYP